MHKSFYELIQAEKLFTESANLFAEFFKFSYVLLDNSNRIKKALEAPRQQANKDGDIKKLEETIQTYSSTINEAKKNDDSDELTRLEKEFTDYITANSAIVDRRKECLDTQIQIDLQTLTLNDLPTELKGDQYKQIDITKYINILVSFGLVRD